MLKILKKNVRFCLPAHLYSSFEMEKSIDYVGLVQKAQLGDKECLNRLAEAVRERLYAYVYRYTLADDLTNDIVQETILKMFEALGELREAEQFWPWLHKIALNKIRLHHRNKQQHRTIPDPDMNHRQKHKDSQEVIAGMVYQEFRETVFAAMRELKLEHRSIINMRCYDQMRYSEIAKVIGRSEFAAQKLFFRAKKSLKKKLARHGLGKGSLPIALVLFGKLTAPSKAAAASISVTSATVKVGVAASVAGIVATKTAIISLVAAGALTGGTMVATSWTDKAAVTHGQRPTRSSYVTAQAGQSSEGNEECWYYYPSRSNGAVMLRFESKAGGKQSYSLCLQNDKANYHKRKNTIYINNYRIWRQDLAVWRLPTDSPQLTDFLSRVQGQSHDLEYVSNDGDGLLVIANRDKDNNLSQVTQRHDVLDKEFFRYDWPKGAKTVDNRDPMHRRGWTYFRIEGQINSRQVSGTGRLPFVYAALEQNSPWLRLRVGNQSKTATNFAGLSRPWMGLHTIDTVRRDAAAQQLWFATELLSDDKARVTLTHNAGKMVYTIDTKADVVDKIEFLTDGQKQGELRFSYLQDIDGAGNEFTEPSQRIYRQSPQKNAGILWLVRLAKE